MPRDTSAILRQLPRHKPVHGPFDYGVHTDGTLAAGKLGRERKAEIIQKIEQGRCDCQLCKKHGKRLLPEEGYFWARMAHPNDLKAGWDRKPTWIFPTLEIDL